jgi:hypothetical protein
MQTNPTERLEELRTVLRAERMSYSELAELQSLAAHIAPGDVELLEAAGVPEGMTAHEQQAYELGAEHARNAASWCIDGNTSKETILALVVMIEDGDPELHDHLPREPNLSGEFADDPTPSWLAYEVGLDPTGFGTDADQCIEIDAVCDAYEAGVSDTFQQECERILRAAL